MKACFLVVVCVLACLAGGVHADQVQDSWDDIGSTFSDSSTEARCSYTLQVPGMDMAQLRIMHDGPANENVSLYYTSGECHNCLAELLFTVSLNESSCYMMIPTPYDIIFELRSENSDTRLSFHQTLQEHGVYTLHFSIVNPIDEDGNANSGSFTYQLNTESSGINTYLPLWITFGALGGLALLWQVILFIYRRVAHDTRERHLYVRMNQESAVLSDDISGPPPPPSPMKAPLRDPLSVPARKSSPSSRLVSLDAFRGMSITIMIFVNFGGGGYYFFNHSIWNGLTVADLVFPWFIFIMGVAMPMSFKALKAKRVPTGTILLKIVRRTITLWALGMFINNGTWVPHWRIPGVLQRFALSYFFVSLILLFVPTLTLGTGKKHADDDDDDDALDTADATEALLAGDTRRYAADPARAGPFADVLPYLLQWAVALILLTLWLLLTFLLPVPGCGQGYLGPGGIGDQGQYRYCTGGAAGYIDQQIFGQKHIYCGPTCAYIYHTGCYDPEGALGFLTSIFLCFMGAACGRILMTYSMPRNRVIRMFVWGVFWCALATLLCKASKNDGWIPINKNLWSPSFIFVMGGSGFIVLCIFYILIDVLDFWNGAPFKYPGMNSIVLYCGHELLGDRAPFTFYFGSSSTWNQQHASLMLSNVLGVSFWVIIAYVMYLNKVFINI